MSMSHSTYLHAGFSPGWPADHKAEDTFDLPDPTEVAAEASLLDQLTTSTSAETEYVCDGELLLKVSTITTRKHTLVATFTTTADARTAARSLNEHEGY